MKYLLLGLLSLVLTTMLFVRMMQAVCVELRVRSGKGKSRRD
jgi:hypothetical protein